MATTMKKGTSRKDLLALCRRRVTTVTVGEMTFRLQNLTEGEKSRYERGVLGKNGIVREDARRKLLVLCLVDDDGKPWFSMADLDALGELDGAVLSSLFDAAMAHVGFQSEDIDELVKNSQAIHAAPSPSS